MRLYTEEDLDIRQWQHLNDDLKFHLKMDKHGWAHLFFNHKNKYYLIYLSDVFDPFENLVHWVDNIAQNRLPATLRIDEEDDWTALIATSINADDITFTVKSIYGDEHYFTSSVNRQTLIKAFQTEIKRFFSQDFDPLHWDKREYDKDDEEFYQAGLKEWVLNHEWK